MGYLIAGATGSLGNVRIDVFPIAVVLRVLVNDIF